MLPEKPAHGFFVFLGGEGAGAVHQPSAGAQHSGRTAQDTPLPLGTARGRGGVPFGAGFGVAAEHAFAAAGGVHQHGIKQDAPARGQRLRLGAHNKRVGYAHPLDVAAQDFCTGRHRFVGYQQPFARQRRGNLRALAAGRGAQVQNAFAGPGRKHAHRSHGAGFLQIICARFMQRIGSGGAVVAQIAPQRRVPRHRFLHAAHGFQRRAGDGLLRVQAQAAQTGHLHCGEVGVRLFSQLRVHAGHKGGRQRRAHSLSTSQSGFMMGSKAKNRGLSASGKASFKCARPAIMLTGRSSCAAAC